MKIHARTHYCAFARWGYRLGLLAALVFVAAIWAHREDKLPTHALLNVLALSFTIACIAILLAIVGLGRIWRYHYVGTRLAGIGILLALAVLVVPAVGLYQARQYPRLNDISTDLVDRPRYNALKEYRDPQLNMTGPEGAQQLQRHVYPHLSTHRYKLTASEVFDLVEAAANQAGWRIASVRRPARGVSGVLEATVRTGMFRFPDDVLVRVVADEEQSLVDMRSSSRFGISDLGVNAVRISAFLSQLDVAVMAVLQAREEAIPLGQVPLPPPAPPRNRR